MENKVLATIAILISIVYLMPILWMTALAFIPEAVQRNMAPFHLSMENILDVLNSGAFGLYTLNTFFVTAIVIAGNTLFALMAGYAFARFAFPLSKVLFTVILASLAVPKQVLIVPLFILFGKISLRNTLMGIALPFLADGFNIFLMKQTIEALPKELEDAARVDGCNDYRVLFHVIMPLCKPAMAVAAINTAIVTWNNFLIPLIMIDDSRLYTLPLGLAHYSQGPQGLDWGHLMAGALISSLPIMIVFAFLQRHVIAAMIQGGVKG